MRYINKKFYREHATWIALACVVLVFMFVGLFSLSAQGTVQSGTTYTVAHVLSRKSRGVQKYIYKDLAAGLKRIDRAIKIKQTFVDFTKLQDTLFGSYDAVIVHNTRRTDTLDPAINDFVLKHKDNPKLLVTAYIPKGRSELSNPPAGVDIISSSSKENPAGALVIRVLAPRLRNVLMQ